MGNAPELQGQERHSPRSTRPGDKRIPQRHGPLRRQPLPVHPPVRQPDGETGPLQPRRGAFPAAEGQRRLRQGLFNALRRRMVRPEGLCTDTPRTPLFKSDFRRPYRPEHSDAGEGGHRLVRTEHESGDHRPAQSALPAGDTARRLCDTGTQAEDVLPPRRKLRNCRFRAVGQPLHPRRIHSRRSAQQSESD